MTSHPTPTLPQIERRKPKASLESSLMKRVRIAETKGTIFLLRFTKALYYWCITGFFTDPSTFVERR